MAHSQISFNILLKQENEIWIAHCLELDIVATADSLEQAKNDLFDLIKAQLDYALENDNMAYFYHAAPREIWKEFFSCQKQELFSCVLGTPEDRESIGPNRILANACLSEGLCHA